MKEKPPKIRKRVSKPTKPKAAPRIKATKVPKVQKAPRSRKRAPKGIAGAVLQTVSHFFTSASDPDPPPSDPVPNPTPGPEMLLARAAAQKLYMHSVPVRQPPSPPDGKFLVIGIDMGSRNMGFSVLPLNFHQDPEQARHWIHAERSDLLHPKDGRIYTRYEERFAGEMLYTWIQERQHYFQRAALVVIEKSMADISTRVCLYLEGLLSGMLWAKRGDGGPLHLITSPTAVKNSNFIETGNHEQLRAHLNQSGKTFDFHNPKHRELLGKARLENKQRAIDHFWAMYRNGHPFARILVDQNNMDVTPDAVDAFFEALYAYHEFEDLCKKALTTSHHNRDSSGRIRFTANERYRPTTPLI